MKDIVIIGAGGFGREVAWLIEEINMKTPTYHLLGFIDDSLEVGYELNGYKVIGNTEWLKDKDFFVVCAVGNPITKKKIILQLKNTKIRYPILIHPSVNISSYTKIGEGSIVCAGNILTVNILIGKHVIINLDCTIGHDAVIEDYCTILPSVNVSGNVKIEECVSVGTGTQIIQGLCIGNNSIIGAGAVVTKDIPNKVVAVGAPAKPIKTIE